jgi:hypothetical protein
LGAVQSGAPGIWIWVWRVRRARQGRAARGRMRGGWRKDWLAAGQAGAAAARAPQARVHTSRHPAWGGPPW